MQNNINSYGLLNLYSAQKFMNAYFAQNDTTMAEFYQYLGITKADNVPENLIFMVEGWLFDSSWTNLTSRDLLYGWQTPIADRVNTGDFWQGPDKSVSDWVVPILNDQNGPVANVPYGLYSGSFDIDNVSAIRLLNGEAYLNKLTPYWNGTYYT